MRDERMNSLAQAASAYLRSAMHQPVEWMEWGEAAFDAGADGRQADPAGYWRGVVPLVPCDGPRVAMRTRRRRRSSTNILSR